MRAESLSYCDPIELYGKPNPEDLVRMCPYMAICPYMGTSACKKIDAQSHREAAFAPSSWKAGAGSPNSYQKMDQIWRCGPAWVRASLSLRIFMMPSAW